MEKKEKTGIGKLLEKIGNFFDGLFNRAGRVWNKLGPDVQGAFIQGSEILQIINQNVDEDGDFILMIIKSKFPNLDVDKLRSGLIKVMEALNIGTHLASQPTIQELLEELALYLKSKEKDVWAGVTSLAAKLIAHSLAGKLISWATLELLMEFVYRTFIKKDK